MPINSCIWDRERTISTIHFTTRSDSIKQVSTAVDSRNWPFSIRRERGGPVGRGLRPRRRVLEVAPSWDSLSHHPSLRSISHLHRVKFINKKSAKPTKRITKVLTVLHKSRSPSTKIKTLHRQESGRREEDRSKRETLTGMKMGGGERVFQDAAVSLSLAQTEHSCLCPCLPGNWKWKNSGWSAEIQTQHCAEGKVEILLRCN